MRNFFSNDFLYINSVIENFKSADYESRKEIIKKIKDVKGVRIEIDSSPKSTCYRDIDCIAIGNQKNPVLLCAAFHAMESITALVLLVFLFDLLNEAKNSEFIKKKLEKQGFFIIPCINPDGVEIFLHGEESAGEYKWLVRKICNGNLDVWQANARGVDLNHNFDAMWEKLRKIEIENNINGPSRTRYGGAYAHSEQETKFLTQLCKTKNFCLAAAFHSQGEEIYYSFNGNTPKNSKEIAVMLSEKSGYKISEPDEKIASFGGFKDWFISYFNKPAFTVEVGKGVNPLPLSYLKNIYYRLRNMFFYLVDTQI